MSAYGTRLSEYGTRRCLSTRHGLSSVLALVPAVLTTGPIAALVAILSAFVFSSSPLVGTRMPADGTTRHSQYIRTVPRREHSCTRRGRRGRELQYGRGLVPGRRIRAVSTGRARRVIAELRSARAEQIAEETRRQ
eukprot:2904743-Rhodomonas_salina.1